MTRYPTKVRAEAERRLRAGDRVMTVCRAMGLPDPVVYYWRKALGLPRLNAAHETNRLGYMDMSGERCRCGLRLPCNSCLSNTARDLGGRTSHWSDDKGSGLL